MNGLAETCDRLDIDHQMALAILTGIETKKNIVADSTEIKDQIDIVKGYFECLMRDKNISLDRLRHAIQAVETQKIYKKLNNISSDYFSDFISYNIWSEYNSQGKRSLHIKNNSTKEELVCSNFWELYHDDLAILLKMFDNIKTQELLITKFISEDDVETPSHIIN